MDPLSNYGLIYSTKMKMVYIFYSLNNDFVATYLHENFTVKINEKGLYILLMFAHPVKWVMLNSFIVYR